MDENRVLKRKLKEENERYIEQLIVSGMNNDKRGKLSQLNGGSTEGVGAEEEEDEEEEEEGKEEGKPKSKKKGAKKDGVGGEKKKGHRGSVFKKGGKVDDKDGKGGKGQFQRKAPESAIGVVDAAAMKAAEEAAKAAAVEEPGSLQLPEGGVPSEVKPSPTESEKAALRTEAEVRAQQEWVAYCKASACRFLYMINDNASTEEGVVKKKNALVLIAPISHHVCA